MAQLPQMHDMMTSSYGDGKLSKENELNDTMSIAPSAPDSYENTLMQGKGE